MATRAYIAYERPDGWYTYNYCHFDNYPDRIIGVLRNMTHEDFKKACETDWRFFPEEAYNENESDNCAADWEIPAEDYTYVLKQDGHFYMRHWRGKFSKIDFGANEDQNAN